MTRPGAASIGLLTPCEVRTAFRISKKTLWRWTRDGKLTSIRTIGGHRRFRSTEVAALLNGGQPERGTP